MAKGYLALRALNWTAYVAALKADELPPAHKMQVPDLEILRARATASSMPLTQIQFGRGDRAVIYKSKDGRSVLGAPELSSAIRDLRVTDIDEAVANAARWRQRGNRFLNPHWSWPNKLNVSAWPTDALCAATIG